MTEDTTTGRIERLLDSQRAMIPLALVGALLLLSSVLLVGYMQTSEEPEPNVDASLALDRTEATMQTIVRDGTQRAAKRAATEPMTDPADTEWGAILGNSGPGFSEDPFENYLRALVYLEVSEDLDLASQEDGDVETNVTLPPVSTPGEFADAIRRVDLDGNESDVTVSLSNVTIAATHAGEVIEERETTVEVIVVTPVLQLHDRVSEYQHAIDEAGVTEPGFTQRFNARTYAIGWARGWAQNYQAPIGEILANRHIEPSANSALYRTQRDVFGAADPDLQNAVRLGWNCMALKDGKTMFDEYVSDRGGLSYDSLQYDGAEGTLTYNDSHAVDVPGEGGLCSETHFLFDQAVEQHPQPPDVMEIIGGTDLLQENETQSVGELAYYPLVELMDDSSDHSFENVTQRIFTIEGDVDAETRTTGHLSFSLSCGPGYVSGPTFRDGSYDVTTTNQEPVTDDDERYYVYESEINVTVTATRFCFERSGNGTAPDQDTDSYTIELTTTVGEEGDSPFATVDDVNPASEVSTAYKYNPGPDGWGPTQFNNYDGAGEQVTARILGGTDLESHEEWVSDRMDGTDYERGAPEEYHFETTEVVELDYETLLDDFELKAEMTDTVAELRETAANVSVEFERQELVTGNPTSQLLDELESEVKDPYVDESEEYQYESVGEKILYEARHAYYLTLVEQLEGLEDAHGMATNELDDRITATDGLGNATRFIAQGIRQQGAEPDTFTSSELTEDVSYEISGSPTYLRSAETVDTERVPPVDQDIEFAPLRAKNENAFDLPYDDVINEILSVALEVLPKVSASPDAELTLRMAGDVLSAGELALDAHESAETTDREDAYLNETAEFEENIERFEENVEEALETFEQRVAKQTVAGLYPSPAAECFLYPASGHERHPGQETCTEALQEHGELEDVVIEATWAVEDGIADALAPYETAETARLVGHGNATEFIVDNVSRELDEPEYRTEAFSAQYDDDQWDELVEAALKPAVAAASATSVELGSAEQAEELDETIQAALGEATTAAVEDRLADAGEVVGETIGERWLGNTKATKQRAARVPAGLPLLPLPGKWVATANAWTIEVAGEYARFEASATLGTPADGTKLTYVRENRTVDHEIAGAERTLGAVEEIAFDSQSVVVVVTPPGVGVGDRDSENPECSATYPSIGEIDPDREEDCSSFSAAD